MECGYHRGVTAIAQCRACHLGLCVDCAEQKPVPKLGLVTNSVARAYSGLKAGDRSPFYVCRQTCEAYDRQVRVARTQNSVVSGILGIQALTCFATLAIAGVGIVVVIVGALTLGGVKSKRVANTTPIAAGSSPVAAGSSPTAVGSSPVAAASPVTAGSSPVTGASPRAPAGTPPTSPAVDLSHVEIGQRYVFSHASRTVTWIVESIGAEDVTYQIAETGASVTWHGDGQQGPISLDRTSPGTYVSPAGERVPCLVKRIGDRAEYRYATDASGQVTFPGQLERRHEDGSTSWQLQAIEAPRGE